MSGNVFESLPHPWWTLVIFAVLTVVMIAVMTRQGAPLITEACLLVARRERHD